MAKRFKRNAAGSFVMYMVDSYGLSRSVWKGEISKEGDIYNETGLEALEQVRKSNFWVWDDGSSILFWL